LKSVFRLRGGIRWNTEKVREETIVKRSSGGTLELTEQGVTTLETLLFLDRVSNPFFYSGYPELQKHFASVKRFEDEPRVAAPPNQTTAVENPDTDFGTTAASIRATLPPLP